MSSHLLAAFLGRLESFREFARRFRERSELGGDELGEERCDVEPRILDTTVGHAATE